MGEDLRVKLNMHHALVQVLYFIGFSALWAYGPVLLLQRGLSDSTVGTITALALLAPVVLQPILSSLADRYARLTSRSLALALALTAVLIAAFMWGHLGSTDTVAVCYALGGMVMVTLSPFINSMLMGYYLRGIDVNFGLGRGVGSAAYAMVVLVVGFAVEKRDPSLIVPVFFAGAVGLTVVLLLFRYPLPPAGPAERASESAPVLNVVQLLRKYPAFALLLAGCALLQGTHNAIATYFIHIAEKVGSGEGLMGTIMALSAFTELLAMPLFPRLHRRFSLKVLFRLCAVFFCIRTALFLFAAAPWMLYVSAAVQFFEYGIFLPCTVYYVAEKLDGANQIKGQGLIHVFCNGAGPALITFLSGQVMGHSGINGVLTLQLLSAAAGVAVIFLATSRRIDKERTI